MFYHQFYDRIKSLCVKYTTERNGKTTITHGFDKDGNEIYTKTETKSFFGKSVKEV